MTMIVSNSKPTCRARSHLGLCVFLAATSSLAQNFERSVNGAPFEYRGETLALPFFGGVNFFLPQFLDIDGDDDLDLFLLKPFTTARERQLEGRLTFLENSGTPQTPRFEFRTHFYHDLDAHNWFQFLDFDADGDFDLYHDNGAGGLALQRNIGTRTQAQFAPAQATVLDRDNQKVASEFSSTPAFADIDGDGDFDFLTGLTVGSIVLYRNVGNASVPLFAFETNRWQDVVIISGGAQQHVSATPALRKEAFAHGGNVIAFHDLERDGDQDFFYGDFFHASLYHFRNEGAAQQARLVLADSAWPLPAPLHTRGFNAPRFADLNHDGYAELFVAAWNQEQQNFFFYQNEARSEAPSFRLQTANFLSQLDVGGNCAPALADLDSDADFDLVLGTFDGDLLFFENHGTRNAPAFRETPQKFPALKINGYVATPALIDIDGDHDIDLFAGAYAGAIAFFENQGTPQAPSFTLKTPVFEGIRVSLYSAPHFADLDHDGDYDLAVGEIERSAVSFYENIGDKNAPRFLFKAQFLPDHGATEVKPFLYDWNRDGRVDLFLGQRNGRVLYYQGASALFSDTFTLAQNEFGNVRVGAVSAMALADLNGDGAEDLLVGEEAGGLNYYINREGTNVAHASPAPSAFTLHVYPNPFRAELRVALQTPFAPTVRTPHVKVYAVTGALVAELPLHKMSAALWEAQWRNATTALAAGLYLVQVEWGQQRLTQKVLFMP